MTSAAVMVREKHTIREVRMVNVVDFASHIEYLASSYLSRSKKEVARKELHFGFRGRI
jgi:hypothetical protein